MDIMHRSIGHVCVEKDRKISMQDKCFGKQVIVFLVIMGVALYYCCVKSGYFLDEIYSFGLSNSEYAPFLTKVMGGDITEKVITHKDLFDYVTAGENRFHYASVYYNQTQDVHPPLYYCVLHTVCSIFPTLFSKWLGLFPNMIFYVLTIYLLLRISNALFGHTIEISLSVITLYGLSAAGLATVLFVRMYMLMTLLTVLFAYLILKLMRHERYYLYPFVSFIIFMGMMTHYYFVFYVFFLCLFYAVYQWKKKQYSKMFVFSFFAMLGIVCFYLEFPGCTIQMMKGTADGATAWQRLQAFNEYASRCYGLFRKLVRDLFLTFVFGGGVLLALVLNYKKVVRQFNRIWNAEAVIIITPAFAALLMIICISTPNIRYIYNLLPFYVLLIGYMMFALKCIGVTVKKYFLSMLLFTGIMVSFMLKPDFLYTEYKQYDQLIKPYETCVYISNNINPCITSDLCQLLKFDEVFVTNVSNICNGYEDLCNYMESANTVVIYISKYKNLYGCDEVINILAGTLQGGGMEKLYEGDFSTAYLFNRNTF